MAERALPKAVRALWGTDETPRRGPRPAMTVPQIAAAGVEIADAEGLSAVSMSAVARRLGFTTMSLYRYVDDKDDLHLAMVDVALGPPPEISIDSPWREGLESWARAEATRLAAHPWVLDVRPGTPPLSPHLLAWMDLGLRVLDRSGLPAQAAASALLVVDGYARSNVMLGVQYGGGESWADQVRTVVDADHLPTLSEALAAGVFDDSAETDRADQKFPGDEFEFGLRLVLDGIEQLTRPSRARRQR
jgi:AcrR family transcriptional regulator